MLFCMQRMHKGDSRTGAKNSVDAKASKLSIEADIKRTMKAARIQRDVVSSKSQKYGEGT